MSSSSFFFFLFPEQGKPGPVNTFPSHGSRVLQLTQTLADITESPPCADEAPVSRQREPRPACAPPSRECTLPSAPRATTHLPWSALGRLCWGPGRTYHFPTLTFKRLLTAHTYLTLSAVPWASYLYL